jgi:hypothetical protein
MSNALVVTNGVEDLWLPLFKSDLHILNDSPALPCKISVGNGLKIPPSLYTSPLISKGHSGKDEEARMASIICFGFENF